MGTKLHLRPGREERAAAAAQVRGVELVDHLVRRHRARLRERLEAADRLVVGDLGERAAVRAGEDDLRRRARHGSSLDSAQLRDDARHVLRLHVQAVAVVDRDDRRPAAAAEALDGAQRERPSSVVSPACDAELALERLDAPAARR